MATFRWRVSALDILYDDGDPVDLSLHLDYSAVLQWLWGRWCLADLLNTGVPVQATDVFLLSAVDGLVKAPTVGARPDDQYLACARSLGRIVRSASAASIAATLREWYPVPT